MTREREIEIMMMDRCTKSEAKKFLENGSCIFEDLEERFDSYMEEWDMEENEIEEHRKMITTHEPARDWGVVKDGDKYYYIMYVL